MPSNRNQIRLENKTPKKKKTIDNNIILLKNTFLGFFLKYVNSTIFLKC